MTTENKERVPITELARRFDLDRKTVYTYSNMDRVETRTDPLTHAESYSYDNNGNLTSHTEGEPEQVEYEGDHEPRLWSVGANRSITCRAADVLAKDKS